MGINSKHIIYDDIKVRIFKNHVILIKKLEDVRIQVIVSENEELRKAIESSYDGISICESNGNTLFVNEAIERITELKRVDVVGKNMSDLVQNGVFNKSVAMEVIKKKQTVTIMQQVNTYHNYCYVYSNFQ